MCQSSPVFSPPPRFWARRPRSTSTARCTGCPWWAPVSPPSPGLSSSVLCSSPSRSSASFRLVQFFGPMFFTVKVVSVFQVGTALRSYVLHRQGRQHGPMFFIVKVVIVFQVGTALRPPSPFFFLFSFFLGGVTLSKSSASIRLAQLFGLHFVLSRSSAFL